MIDAGTHGVWIDGRVLPADPRRRAWVARTVGQTGFAALWLAGAAGVDPALPGHLLAGSSSLVVGTSVTNVRRTPAGDLAAAVHRWDSEHGPRFLTGLGSGRQVGTRADALAAVAAYLDELDAAPHPVPAGRRALAAVGPRTLELAGRRSLGALPWLTTVEHTRTARATLGPDALLAPVVKVILEADPDSAHALARADLAPFLENLRKPLLREGFGEDDLKDGGSDDLLDALYAWGTTDQVTARLSEYRAAGATHLALHPLPVSGSGFPLNEIQTLGAVLAP